MGWFVRDGDVIKVDIMKQPGSGEKQISTGETATSERAEIKNATQLNEISAEGLECRFCGCCVEQFDSLVKHAAKCRVVQ